MRSLHINDERFKQRTRHLIERMQKADHFFLAHIYELDGIELVATVFGDGICVFSVPFIIGEEADAETGRKINKMMRKKWLGEENGRDRKWVPLPDYNTIRTRKTDDGPAITELATTDIVPDSFEQPDLHAAEIFYVQSKYLKMALQFAPFKGERSPKSPYNPLCLWANNDDYYDGMVEACILPYVPNIRKVGNHEEG